METILVRVVKTQNTRKAYTVLRLVRPRLGCGVRNLIVLKRWLHALRDSRMPPLSRRPTLPPEQQRLCSSP